MTDLSLKQDSHPAHNMPPHQNYTHPNDTIFEYTDSEQNQNQGPSKYHAEGEGAANYANETATRKAFMNGEYDSTGTYKGRK